MVLSLEPDTGRLPQVGMLIDGERRSGLSQTTYECRSPRDGKPLAAVAAGGSEDVDRAVAAARCAFTDRRWSGLPVRERKTRMLAWSGLVTAHREELAELICREMGKPVQDALTIEVDGLSRTLGWYAELADKLVDEAISSDDVLALVTRQPAGVVGAVMPWNFPLSMIGYNVAPALAVGNSLVVKPDEHTPLSTLRVAELALDAGIPPGVLNVVTGTGEQAGRAVGLHPDIDVVTFTGSIDVGRQFLRYAADSNLKRVWLKLGGKTANIVMSDCPDLDAAVDMALWAVFFNQGEMCTAGSRLLLHRDIHDRFLERLLDRMTRVVVGDPLDTSTTMGPLVSEEHLREVQGYIERAIVEGATLNTGGNRLGIVPGGNYLEPTIFTGVDPDMEIAQQEIFGPVLAVLRFDTVEEAITIANGTRYGLASAVWTADLVTAHTMSRRLRSGTVWINCFEDDDVRVPFGGVKQSGFGRDKGRMAVEKYLDVKTTWMRMGPA
ncbi:aldehyde dehydrogenase [Micromonospora sp. NPDC047762]|uniref:aldehyde dehydrogenase n=1 Tax=unclassified Micromonospora TaxID=2617518 RepID=UPI0033CBC22D